MKPPTSVSFLYPKPTTAKFDARKIQAWKGRWPDARVASRPNGGTQVDAPVAAHRELIIESSEMTDLLHRRVVNLKDLRYTLTYDGDLAVSSNPLASN